MVISRPEIIRAKPIAKFQLPCLVSYILDGSGVGNYPHYQQILIDYIHYRYGQTK